MLPLPLRVQTKHCTALKTEVPRTAWVKYIWGNALICFWDVMIANTRNMPNMPTSVMRSTPQIARANVGRVTRRTEAHFRENLLVTIRTAKATIYPSPLHALQLPGRDRLYNRIVSKPGVPIAE